MSHRVTAALTMAVSMLSPFVCGFAGGVAGGVAAASPPRVIPVADPVQSAEAAMGYNLNHQAMIAARNGGLSPTRVPFTDGATIDSTATMEGTSRESVMNRRPARANGQGLARFRVAKALPPVKTRARPTSGKFGRGLAARGSFDTQRPPTFQHIFVSDSTSDSSPPPRFSAFHEGGAPSHIEFDLH